VACFPPPGPLPRQGSPGPWLDRAMSGAACRPVSRRDMLYGRKFRRTRLPSSRGGSPAAREAVARPGWAGTPVAGETPKFRHALRPGAFPAQPRGPQPPPATESHGNSSKVSARGARTQARSAFRLVAGRTWAGPRNRQAPDRSKPSRLGTMARSSSRTQAKPTRRTARGAMNLPGGSRPGSAGLGAGCSGSPRRGGP